MSIRAVTIKSSTLMLFSECNYAASLPGPALYIWMLWTNQKSDTLIKKIISRDETIVHGC